MNGLGQFLAAIRQMEGGDYGREGPAEEGVIPFGAYGILKQNWGQWSAAAGLVGHDRFDPAAQDAVASYWGQRLFQRYGSWEMAAAAWFSGAEQTDFAARSGEGLEWFRNPRTKEYLAKFVETLQNPEVQAAQVPRAGQQWINPGGTPRGWLSPVAGRNEYSNSFMVARNNKAGIHGAIDIYASAGTPIVAPVGGKVISTRQSDIGGFTVRVQGDDGLTYYFAHMQNQAVVENGSKVTAGDHLGFVGNSGNARGTSPHLHFSARRGGTIVNPYSYLQGARNAGNYFAPDSAEHQLQAPTIRDKFTSTLDSVSQQVADGQRVDYRTIGLAEGTEAAETGMGIQATQDTELDDKMGRMA